MQPFNPNSPQLFACFGLLMAVSVLSSLFFWLNKNAALKRRLLPWVGIVTGLLFFGTIWVAGFPMQSFYTFGPMIALGVWLNVRALQFCGSCGATVRGTAFFSRPKFCPKCGASLSDEHK